MIALFVPAVSASADGVAAAIARAAAASSHEKPVLAVVMSAGGIPAALRQDNGPPLPSRFRSPPPGRSVAPPSGPTG